MTSSVFWYGRPPVEGKNRSSGLCSLDRPLHLGPGVGVDDPDLRVLKGHACLATKVILHGFGGSSCNNCLSISELHP